MSGSLSHAVNIGSTYGVTFVGQILKSIFYGMTLVQTWSYFCSRDCRRKDLIAMKGFIAFVTFLDTLHTALCTYVLYWYLIQNFANVENLDVGHWSMEVQITLNSFLTFMVQLFYARQLYLLSHNITVVVIIVGLILLVFSISLVFSVRQTVLNLYSRDSSLIWVACVGMGSSTLVDLLISLSMCWCLYHRKTGFARTDSMIKTLMINIMSSGLLTSLLSSATLISFAVAPHTLISQSFYGPLGTSYVNSLLAFLNNRDLIVDGFNPDNSRTSHRTRAGPTSISVTVHRTAAADMDLAKSMHDSEKEATALELKGLEDASIPSAHEVLMA